VSNDRFCLLRFRRRRPLRKAFRGRTDGEALLWAEVERRFGAEHARAHAEGAEGLKETTTEDKDEYSFGDFAPGANVPDIRSMEQRAQATLDEAMGAAGGDRDKSQPDTARGQASDGKQAHEFEKRGATVLEGCVLTVTTPAMKRSEGISDGDADDDSGGSGKKKVPSKRGRVTATGGTSAQIAWDEGGTDIVDLATKGVIFVVEAVKLRFVDGKLRKDGGGGDDESDRLNFVFDPSARAAEEAAAAAAKAAAADKEDAAPDSEEAKLAAKNKAAADADAQDLPPIEGQKVRFGGYSGCVIKRVVGGADSGAVIISIPGVGDKTAKRGDWSYVSPDDVRKAIATVTVGALVVVRDDAWSRGVYDWAVNVPSAVRAIRATSGSAAKAVIRLPPHALSDEQRAGVEGDGDPGGEDSATTAAAGSGGGVGEALIRVVLVSDLVVTAPPSEANKAPPSLDFVFPSRGSRYAPGGTAAAQRFTLTTRALESLGGKIAHCAGQLAVVRRCSKNGAVFAGGTVAVYLGKKSIGRVEVPPISASATEPGSASSSGRSTMTSLVSFTFALPSTELAKDTTHIDLRIAIVAETTKLAGGKDDEEDGGASPAKVASSRRATSAKRLLRLAADAPAGKLTLAAHAPRGPTAPPPYIAAPTMEGFKQGYLYRSGPLGLGYYRDESLEESDAAAAAKLLTECVPTTYDETKHVVRGDNDGWWQ
jgi:hypothetical protein